MKKIIKMFILCVMLSSVGILLFSCFNESDCEKGDHNWGEWQVVDATCTTAGKKTRVCSVCQEKEEQVIEPLGHNPSKVDAKNATCEEKGIIAHYHCDRCNKNFSDEDCEEEIEIIETEFASHTYPEGQYEYNATYHWQVCSVCGVGSTREAHDGDECSVCGYKKLPSLKAVMTNIASLRNYTYVVEDKIFDVTTTLRYTEKAYYYEPNKEEHGGVPYGYAQSNNDEIFQFVIANGEVTPGYQERWPNGSYKNDLWDQSILSLYDIDLEALSDTPTTNNTYIISDDNNKTLFALLAGYGDVYAAVFVTVTVEVVSENSIKAIVHFEPENEKYIGDCICTMTNIGTTTIPEIETYLNSGKGPKVADAEDVANFLAKVKGTKQYQIEVTADNKHYIDTFNENYYYSENVLDTNASKGYLAHDDKVYNITMKDGKIVLGSEITYTSSTDRSLWANVSLKSFANINLTGFSGTRQEDGSIKLEYSQEHISVMSTLHDVTHDSSFFFTVSSSDYIVFTKMTEDLLSYTYYTSSSSVSVTISLVDEAKNEVIEDYIANAPDPNDISKLKEALTALVSSKEYTVEVQETLGVFFTAFTKQGNKNITFKEKEYFVENLKTAENSFGYGEDETGVYNLDKDKVKGDYVKKDDVTVKGLYTSGLVSSFANIDVEKVVATQNMDGSFNLSDSETISMIFNIAGYDGATVVKTFTSLNVTITDNTLVIKAVKGSDSITITVSR